MEVWVTGGWEREISRTGYFAYIENRYTNAYRMLRLSEEAVLRNGKVWALEFLDAQVYRLNKEIGQVEKILLYS